MTYGVVLVALVVGAGGFAWRHLHQATATGLPLTSVTSIPLPGDTSRFDYASLDPERHLLFVAHLGASEIVEVDTAGNRVIRVVDHIPGVHGVLVVPSLGRVYATATDTDEVVALDEETGAILSRAPTGAYPDGLAYDPNLGRIWVTNESGGSETVLDVTNGDVVATVDVGGDAGNVAYDPGPSGSATVSPGRILVDVQSRNEVVVIDAETFQVTGRVALPGCEHPHGLALDPEQRLGFIACDGNAKVFTLDLDSLAFYDPVAVGGSPDVVALDSGIGWLYVAAETGRVTVLEESGKHLRLLGRDDLAEGAHVVAIDPTTHYSYFPIAHGSGGRPELLVWRPNR